MGGRYVVVMLIGFLVLPAVTAGGPGPGSLDEAGAEDSEAKVDVAATATTHIVEIGPEVISVGYVAAVEVGRGALSFYSPADLVIQIGDHVVWKNVDPAGLPHSATDCPDPVPVAPCQETPRWESGIVDADETSAPIRFTSAGTYVYYCTVHPLSPTMGKGALLQHRITVEA